MNFTCDIFLFIVRFLYTGSVIAICFMIWDCIKENSKIGTIFMLHNQETNEITECLWRKDFLIGRYRYADIFIPDQSISRQFAILQRQENSSFLIKKIGTGFLSVNGKEVSSECQLEVSSDDELIIGNQIYKVIIESRRVSHSFFFRREATILSLFTVFVILVTSNSYISFGYEIPHLLFCFGPILIIPWCYWGIVKYFHLKSTITTEITAFLLSAISLAIAAPSPETLLKVSIYITLGFCAFIAVSFFSKYYQNQTREGIYRIKKILLLLLTIFFVVNIFLAPEINGSRNWIYIAGVSIQPGEVAKLLIVPILATPLELIGSSKTNKNGLLIFIAAICSGLAYILIGDLGGLAVLSIIMFSAYFLRSGSLLNFTCVAAIFAVIAKVLSNISSNFHNRIEILGNAFSDPLGRGYQQVQALGAIALGGLFGVGIGNGCLRKVFASDTDLVLFLISEEFGFVFMLTCLSAYILLVFSTVANCSKKNYFGNMLGLLAVTSIIFQVFFALAGGANILPFSGITTPLISIGGSSALVSWGLLAFVAEDFKK